MALSYCNMIIIADSISDLASTEFSDNQVVYVRTGDEKGLWFRSASSQASLDADTLDCASGGRFERMTSPNCSESSALVPKLSLAPLTNFASNKIGTLLNAPAAGNPSKWLGFDDDGVIRIVPSWPSS